MDYRVVYTQKALRDLEEIVGHIAADDSHYYASRFGNSLLDHVDLLSRFPDGSTIPRRKGVRKIVHSPMLIYYQG